MMRNRSKLEARSSKRLLPASSFQLPAPSRGQAILEYLIIATALIAVLLLVSTNVGAKVQAVIQAALGRIP